jgi:hypothetical protein
LINKIIAKLAEANGLKGVIDRTDFNDEDKPGKGREIENAHEVGDAVHLILSPISLSPCRATMSAKLPPLATSSMASF